MPVSVVNSVVRVRDSTNQAGH